MVPHHGCHGCKMFIFVKPMQFGCKLWGICGPDEYNYKLIFTQAKCETRSEPLGSLVVDTMVNVVIENSVASMDTFYFDSFFTSYNF